MLAHVAATDGRPPGGAAAGRSRPAAGPAGRRRPAARASGRGPPVAGTLVAEWPVLEDEWLLTVERRGWRLPPDVLVGLLRRHRTDAARRGRVERLGGAVVPWLLEHQPQLAGPAGSARSARSDDVGLDGLPALAVAPELVALLDAAPGAVAAAVVHGFRGGAYTLAHRNVLVNFVARCRTDALGPLADGLRDLDPALATGGIAHSLADLADTRRLMLEELEPLTTADVHVLRPHAEDQFATELAALDGARRPAPAAELATVAVGGRDVPARRRAARRHLDHAQVRRSAAVDGDRRGHAGHRPGAAAPRRAGYGQDVGQRAPRRRHQRRLDVARPGHGGHDRGDAALRLELRPTPRRGPQRGGAGAQPGVPRHAVGAAGAGRGADPDAVGGAGRAGHDPLGEGAAGARAGHRGRRRRRVQPHRHGQRP